MWVCPEVGREREGQCMGVCLPPCPYMHSPRLLLSPGNRPKTFVYLFMPIVSLNLPDNTRRRCQQENRSPGRADGWFGTAGTASGGKMGGPPPPRPGLLLFPEGQWEGGRQGVARPPLGREWGRAGLRVRPKRVPSPLLIVDHSSGTFPQVMSLGL